MIFRGAAQRFSGARYLIDIIILAAGVFGSEAAFSSIPLPADLRIQIAGSAISKAAMFLLAWSLLRWRGDTLGTVGLKPPHCWWRVLLLSVVVAGMLFVVVLLVERAGCRRNLGQFNFVKGNIELTGYGIPVRLVLFLRRAFSVADSSWLALRQRTTVGRRIAGLSDITEGF